MSEPNPLPRVFAIDFDNTWTADRELWELFTAQAQERGHEVIVITGRADTQENRKLLGEWLPGTLRRYFTNGAPKRWYLLQRGISVHIWIDDSPVSIGS